MFYDPRKNDHGLARDPFKAIVVPRPIGWFTSISAKGEINLAPYSFFNAVSEDPPMVMFSSGGRKDSLSFIEETKEFVCNFATFELRDAVSRGGRLWIGYLDQQGQASSRIVEPVRVEGGFLTAYDATRDSIQRFALHRITGVAQVDPPAAK